MIVLGFVWLILLGIELLYPDIWSRHPALDGLSLLIWAIFLLNFALEVVIAPNKARYLRQNWLTALSLAVPALRVFRLARVASAVRLARASRGARLVKVIGSLNRGMRALGGSMRRRGVGYVVTLTGLVTLGGAAGMYEFERNSPDGLTSYGEAVRWTAMIMTTMGSAYWPVTLEGRVLCVALAMYAFAVFGYVTAVLATYFVGRDAEADDAELASAKALRALHDDLRSLRADLQRAPEVIERDSASPASGRSSG